MPNLDDIIKAVIQWASALDWPAIWQAAIPMIIAGLLLKMCGAV